MTTTTNKSVPRSRLNITYRTRIDGRVVQKELPLRLLVAGNFSGRQLKGPYGREIPGRELPLLDRRPMYAIGKSGNLESVMKLMRIGLPVPDELTHVRDFEVFGAANVRFTQGGEGVTLVKLLHAELDGSAVPSNPAPEGGANGNTKADYQGHLESFVSVEFRGTESGDTASWSPAVLDELKPSGWLEPKRQSPREPAVMYEVTRVRELELTSEPLDVTMIPQGGLERRVQLRAKVEARRVIPLLSMKSFDPEQIAETVPEIRRLLVLRWLISQGRSMIATNAILRAKCKELLLPAVAQGESEQAPEAPVAQLKAQVAALNGHGAFRIRSQERASSESESEEVAEA